MNAFSAGIGADTLVRLPSHRRLVTTSSLLSKV